MPCFLWFAYGFFMALLWLYNMAIARPSGQQLIRGGHNRLHRKAKVGEQILGRG